MNKGVALCLLLTACVTPPALEDNEPSLSATSAKPQADLVSCIGSAWNRQHVPLTLLPEPPAMVLVFQATFGTAARIDISPEGRVELRFAHNLEGASKKLVEATRECL